MKKGFLIGGGILLAGILLQITVGPVRWERLAFPVNLILLIGFLAVMAFMYAFRQKVRFFEWAMQLEAAVPALCYSLVLTILLGLVAQQEDGGGVPWLSQMLDFWPFVLSYAWMMVILGLAALHRLVHFRIKEIPFLLNHLGLFLALVCGALGAPDTQRLHMTTREGETQQQAEDEAGMPHEPGLAIELHDFIMEEYPMQPGQRRAMPKRLPRKSRSIPGTDINRMPLSRSTSRSRWTAGKSISTITTNRRARKVRSVSSNWSAIHGSLSFSRESS